MIYLVNRMDSTRECNNGDIIGRLTSSRPDEHLYTSQLTLTVSADMNSTTIECFHDDGAGNITEVGTSVLNITTGILLCHKLVCKDCRSILYQILYRTTPATK